jgi:hypothetical protein
MHLTIFNTFNMNKPHIILDILERICVSYCKRLLLKQNLKDNNDKKIIIFFMLSCTYLMAADVQLDEESTRKAKCTMGFVAVIGSTAFEWLSQLFVDRNPVVMGITAVNSMLSGDIEKLVGKAYQEKIDQALFVVGICQSPKVTIESYALNFVLSKLAGKQVSAAILGSIALGSLLNHYQLKLVVVEFCANRFCCCIS